MNPRVKKILLLLLAIALLAGSGQVQKSLNQDRDRLGLTRTAALKNAPPMLAFTTVALGGFRGLIANALWVRANDLQIDDKFFEAAQLAQWITDLEPNFTQVWLFQGWNMAYNISVKFKDFSDRWRWVENGIELLRDKGLVYNPNDVLIHRELAWFFQHKMGANLDDANMYYKQQWALEMMPFFGPNGTNYAALLDTQNTNVTLLREKYKLDPALIAKVDKEWGPFDWRLPEPHAIYWATLGLDAAAKNPDKVKADDLITLRRIIYQCMLQSFQHGRLISNPFNSAYALAPNLDLVSRVNDTYEILMKEDARNRDHIENAHRNFLRNAVYFLYENNRMAEANKWFKYLGEQYPNKAIIDGDPTSLPKNVTLDEYAVSVVQTDINETSQDRVTAAVQGLLTQAYYNLTIGQDERYTGFKLLASKVYENYRNKTSKTKGNEERVKLPPYNVLNQTVLNEMLDPKDGIPYAARLILRSQLGLPAETNAPAISTNAVSAPLSVATTNAPATNSAAK